MPGGRWTEVVDCGHLGHWLGFFRLLVSMCVRIQGEGMKVYREAGFIERDSTHLEVSESKSLPWEGRAAAPTKAGIVLLWCRGWYPN